MFASIEIKNFQAHEYFIHKFDRGVTTFIGASDVGKSAVLRAIRWVVLNEPSGDAFIRWNTKIAEVFLTLTNGTVIIRRKGGSENSYTLNGKKFVAFGTTPPEEVVRALSLGQENFQQQHAGVYWFSETAGEVARQLNKIVNLEIIDHTISSISKEGKRIKAEGKVLFEQLEDYYARKAKADFAVKMDERLVVIEKAKLREQTVCWKVVELEALRKKVRYSEGEAAEAVAQMIIGLNVVKAGEVFQARQDGYYSLQKLIIRIEEFKAHENVEVPCLNELVVLEDKEILISNDVLILERLLEKIDTTSSETAEVISLHTRECNRLKEKMGDVCLLCNQTI